MNTLLLYLILTAPPVPSDCDLLFCASARGWHPTPAEASRLFYLTGTRYEVRGINDNLAFK